MKLLRFSSSLYLLKKHGIPFAQHAVVKSREDAVKAALRIGFPVVLKLLSPDVVHKTERGLVKTNISSTHEVEKTYDSLLKKKGRARLEGVLVQEQLADTEIIIGAKHDAQFGPVVLFGLGGIFAEVLKDVSMRVTPITRKDALKMIGEIRGRAVLEGVRGADAANKKRVADVILAVSRLAQREDVAELDLNPCFAGAKCVAADVRILA